MAKQRLNEQVLRTSTAHFWRNEQLMASTILVCPLPLGLGRCAGCGSTSPYASHSSVKYQVPVRYGSGKASHKRRAVAAPRQPNTQATMRRVCRSTASQSQTLRFLCPTNVHISSSSSTRGRLGLDRSGGVACAFFCQFDNGRTRDAGQADNGALRNPFEQQRGDLRIRHRFAGGGGRKHGLVTAGGTLILRLTFQAAIFAHGRATALATPERCLKHSPKIRITC